MSRTRCMECMFTFEGLHTCPRNALQQRLKKDLDKLIRAELEAGAFIPVDKALEIMMTILVAFIKDEKE